MPALHREQGYRLGRWVSNQRTHKDTLSPERRQRLEALGFLWDALTTKWDEGFRYLTVYCQREGHCRVPGDHREHGYPLGSWVSEQRKDRDTMSPERSQRLDALGFVRSQFTAQWEEGFSFLARFHQREGHCRVPQNHREHGYPLGQWVAVQRKKKDTISSERCQRLDALGFVWKVRLPILPTLP